VSTAIDHAPMTHAAPMQTNQESLAAATEKLAALRFFILLTARREGLESADPESSELMRNDLVRLRAQYFDMIDEIAMRHSVREAMHAKQEVEREVTVPREWPQMAMEEAEEAWF
jgi:hypothetical protein